jgi:sigma-E factor negative regulatory protein RseA
MSSEQEQSEYGPGLSALADGQASADETKALCRAWNDKGSARQDWHLYHLIGDTLRSAELARSPDHDQKFLERLSERLKLEPVVLAPHPAAPHAQRQGLRSVRKQWLGLTAVAAGFALVTGALLVMQNNRVWDPQAVGADQLAQSHGAEQANVVAGAEKNAMARAQAVRVQGLVAQPGASVDGRSQLASSAASTNAANGPLMRDPRLERYLRAHKEYGAGAGLEMSAGYLRNASFDAQQP